MDLLKKIKCILEEKFPNNWLDGISESKLKKQLPNIVDETNEQIFEVFCQSVLSGEYVLNSDEEIKKDLDELLITFKQYFDDFGDDDAIQKILKENIKGKLVDFLDTQISYYRQFVGTISLLTRNSLLDISIRFGNDNTSEYNLSEDLKAKSNLFIIYLEVQLVDHFFSDDEGVFEQLTVLLKKLKKSKIPSKLKAPVIEKINFLKHKWILRQYYYSIDDDSITSRGYMQNGDIIEFFGEDEFVTLNSKLKEWSSYLDDHYGLDKHSKSHLQKRADEVKNKKLQDLNFLQLHSLIKYYKDNIKDEKELENICNHLIELNNSSATNYYDSHVTKKFIIYSLNNHFSLISESSTIEDLKDSHKKIESYQAKYNITNYFADKKYATTALEELKTAYKERKYLGNLVDETTKLNHLESILNRCRKRLDWSFKHHSLIFQLKYEDSLVPTQIHDFVGIYYASTFALPIPKYSNIKEFQELEFEFEKLTTSISSISALQIEFKELKKLQENIEKTRDELKQNEIKTLETIGVFTAVIAFILASIPSFTFVKEFYQALLFTGIIGSCLFLMVSLIFLFTRGFKKFNSWIIIGIAVILFCFTIFSLKDSINKVENNIELKYLKKIDSLEVKKDKLDSILKLSTEKKTNP